MLRHTLARFMMIATLVCARPALADEADRLFEQGIAALKEGRHEDARRAFEAVWKQRRTHDVAASLAQAELQLGKFRDAAEHLSYALRTFPITGKEAIRKQMEAAFADAKTKVATLQVTVNVPGAEVLVDGTPAGRAPLADDLFVEPGQHKIEARLAGQTGASRMINVKPGGTEKVELTLASLATPTATATSTATSAPRTSNVPALVLGGAAVAGIAAGAGLLIASAVQLDDAKRQQRAFADAGNKRCSDDTKQCDTIASTLRTSDTLGSAGIGMLIGAVVVGAGAVGYWVITRPPQRQQGSVHLIPVAGPGTGGLVLQGSW